MRSGNRIAALLLAASVAGGAPAQASNGPAPPPGPIRPEPYDQVGRATIMVDGAPAAAHATLPPGSYAEVTAIDSGRTVLVAVTAVARPGHEIELSPAAAQELGLTPGQLSPVRVRAAAAGAEDLAAFRAGKAAAARPDAPPVLLTALRRKTNRLPSPGPATRVPTPPSAKAPARAASPKVPAKVPVVPTIAAAVRSGPSYYVQIAALSDPARASTVARSVGGQVSSAGRLHRVRLGPFADQPSAQAARDALAGRGYGEARIVRE